MGTGGDSGPSPLYIGNLEKRRFQPRGTFYARRKKCLDSNSCFSCREMGCRPCKHASEVNILDSSTKFGKKGSGTSIQSEN